MKPIKTFLAQPPQNNMEATNQLNEILRPMYNDENKSIPERMAIRNLLVYVQERLSQPEHL